jgi:hypothetical protein
MEGRSAMQDVGYQPSGINDVPGLILRLCGEDRVGDISGEATC